MRVYLDGIYARHWVEFRRVVPAEVEVLSRLTAGYLLMLGAPPRQDWQTALACEVLMGRALCAVLPFLVRATNIATAEGEAMLITPDGFATCPTEVLIQMFGRWCALREAPPAGASASAN